MIHQFRDKKEINKRKKRLKIIIGFSVFILISISGMLAYSGGMLYFIGRPIWKAQKVIIDGVHDASFLVRTKSSVFRENELLKKDNEDLRASMMDYEILKKENLDLKELLGRLPENNTFTLASILTKPNRSPYDTIIIDVGATANIQEGQTVYANAITPIGKVSNVYGKTSLVALYSNPGQKMEGTLDISNSTVELIGRGGGNFEMIIPLELGVAKGMMVILPGNNTEIIAVIEEIISIPTDPVKKVILRSPVNIQNIKWVQVKKD